MANVNLAVIPSGWVGGWGQVGFWNNVFWDYTVERTPGVPSIRIEPNRGGATSGSVNRDNPSREVDSKWFNCKPGDRILAIVRIKTDPGQVRDYSGARIGLQLYGGSNALTSPESDYVHWSTSEWTELTIDYVVPADSYTVNENSGATIPATQIDNGVLWLQVWNSYGLADTEPGNAWFTDAELYINPEAEEPPVPPKGCFIATACGTTNKSLSVLRSFRDKCMPPLIIRVYYLLSPGLAALISSHKRIKYVGRRMFEWSAARLKAALKL